MAVDAIAGPSARAETGAQSTASRVQLDKETFMKLLIAQLKNQDPLNPMDSTEYVAQLAAFSQVEQSILINQRLDQLVAQSRASLASDLVGRTVSSDGVNGVVSSVRFTADSLVAEIESGQEVAIGPETRIE